MSFPILVFNFLVFAGVLVKLLGPKLKPAAGARYERIKSELESARLALADAQQRESKASLAVSSLASDRVKISKEYQESAEKRALEIVQDAQKLADRIVQDVGARKSRLLAELQQDLRSEVSDGVIQKAEGLIKNRMTGDEKARLRSEITKDFEVSLR